MILGISSFTYGWSVGFSEGSAVKPMDEQGLINQTLAFGISCLQIGDNLPLHTFDAERLNKLKQEILKNNIRIEIGARKLTGENIEKYIQLAAFLNAPLLRFVIDGPGFEPDSNYVIKIIKNSIPALKANGITLGIENHDRLKAKELARIMEVIGDEHVGVCLDCVNSMGAGEGLEHVADVLMPYTVNLHIKDFVVSRLPHQMGFTVTGAPAGQGITNIALLMEKANQYGRCQSAVLEQWVVPEDNMEATVKKERLWAQESISFLKGTNYFKLK
jgi:sugar phosphate isomerase/epimerase